MMPILHAIAKRRSIRRFHPRPVEAMTLEALLEAARLAPSSINLQPTRILVVDQPEDLAVVRAAAYQLPAVTQAPVLLVIMADLDADGELVQRRVDVQCETPPTDLTALRSGRGKPLRLKMGRVWALINAAIAAQNLVLQATAMGLGTCWNHHFEEDEVREHFAIPSHLELLTLIAVGFPAERPPRRLRRPTLRWEPPKSTSLFGTTVAPRRKPSLEANRPHGDEDAARSGLDLQGAEPSWQGGHGA